MSGLIPQTFIDDLLARTDIIDVISESVSLKKTGRNHQACCPFHQEKTPSFTVNHEKQFYYCFGCGAAGNVINFVMNYHHLDFPAAIDMLSHRLGLEIPREQNEQARRRAEKLKPLYNLSQQAATFYQQQYHTHSERKAAQNYLTERGLTEGTISRFGIGYAPSGWNNLLDYLAQYSHSETLLEESGLLIRHESRQNLYDRFRKRIIFPIRDLRGRIIGFGGRALGDEKPKYLNSPETPIFHKGRELYGLYEARQENTSLERVIVVEGYMDVIALAQHGITNAVATLGTATTTDHIQKLFRSTSEIVFCFDGDSAGRKAAWRAMESALPSMEDGRLARFLFLPQGEDPDSLVFQQGADYFKQQVKQHSETLSEYLLNHIASSIEMHTPEGKAQFAHEVQHYIQQLPEGAYRQILIREIGKRAALDDDQANRLMMSKTEMVTDTQVLPETPLYQPAPTPAFKNPAFYPSKPQPIKIKVTQARLVIRILLKYPALAAKIPLEPLEKASELETRLLVEFVKFLQTSQVKSQSAIRGMWHNTALGDIMAKSQSLDIPESKPEVALLEAVNSLIKKIRKKEQSARSPKEKLKAAQERAIVIKKSSQPPI